MNHADPELKYYQKLQHCLSVEDGCLVHRDRIVIPDQVKTNILRLLHEGYIGIVRTKMLARQYVWWRNIDNEYVSKENIKSFTKEKR